MPYRALLSTEFATLSSVLLNQNRIRIVEDISHDEVSVNALQERLGISHSDVSQQLAFLRTKRLVVERREELTQMLADSIIGPLAASGTVSLHGWIYDAIGAQRDVFDPEKKAFIAVTK